MGKDQKDTKECLDKGRGMNMVDRIKVCISKKGLLGDRVYNCEVEVLVEGTKNLGAMHISAPVGIDRLNEVKAALTSALYAISDLQMGSFPVDYGATDEEADPK